jgi:hypothetical protein
MVLILVKKDWIAEIGGLAQNLLIKEHSDTLSVAYAGRVRTEYPFVFAELAHTGEGKSFVPVHIPVDAIRGVFDLTEADERKLGF